MNTRHSIQIIASFLILHSTMVEAQLPSYLPTSGLVAWYPFNGNANDESGNGNDGVVNGGTIFADRFGNPNASFLFDGIDDNIIVQNSSSLETSHWSINAWFKTSSLEFNRITSKDDQSNPYNDLSLIVLNGNLFISTSINGQTNSILPICQNFVADNSWHHVIASRANGTYLIYLDGEICSSVSDYFPEFSTPNPLYIGSPSPYPSQHFNGQLDDIAIYNRALTQAEVTALYNATATNTGGGTTSTNPAPPGIPYQAEVRNDNGEVLANTSVNVRFTLHELTANGAVSYQETHAITTNELGLFAATIGAGTATQGTFAGINWAQTNKFLQVEVDAGNGYITMGNQQLMSVPYALYAANGPVGPQGEQGPQGGTGAQGLSGLSSLIQTTNEPPGANCPSGGVKIETGHDSDSNGFLEAQEINTLQTKYICNGEAQNTNPVNQNINFHQVGNFGFSIGNILPQFMNYCGNGSLGNVVCTTNQVLANNSNFNNLKIPVGVTAKINSAVTTIIYVKDTLFLDGSIDGSGINGAFNNNNPTNHIGATSCGTASTATPGGTGSSGTGGAGYTFAWNAWQQPSSLTQMGGSITLIPGSDVWYSSCTSDNGSDLSINTLNQIVHFGLDISGGNAHGAFCNYNNIVAGGQGGGGLIIIARFVKFTGSIILNGGNGSSAIGCTYNFNIPQVLNTGGGGGGSCIIRTFNLLNSNGNFYSSGGIQGGGCSSKGGNGSMVILED